MNNETNRPSTRAASVLHQRPYPNAGVCVSVPDPMCRRCEYATSKYRPLLLLNCQTTTTYPAAVLCIYVNLPDAISLLVGQTNVLFILNVLDYTDTYE